MTELQEMSGSEWVGECLRKENIEKVFGLIGFSFLDILDVIDTAGIRFIGVRHEQSAALMADAHARLSRSPAVCIASEGAGAANLLTGVIAAFKAHSPVLALTGGTEVKRLYSDAHQEIDHVGLFRAVTKLSMRVERADRIPEIFNHAFSIAMSGRKGPVHVDIPMDLQNEIARGDMPPRRNETSTNPGIPTTSLDGIIDLLVSAKSPLIIAGGGVVWADATSQLIELAELLDIPVATSHGHNDAFPSDHPLAAGSLGRNGWKPAMNLASKSDLLLVIGSRLGQMTVTPYYGFEFISGRSKIVQIDIEQSEIGRNFPVELGFVSDAKEALSLLIGRVKEMKLRRSNPSLLVELRTLKGEWNQELESYPTSGSALINPYDVYKKLRNIIPKGCVVAVDAGNLSNLAYSYLRFHEPRTFLVPIGIGSVGFSLPSALGAKLARPDRPVIGIMGDGAFSLAIHEVMTAVQERLAVTLIILNNFEWGAEIWYQTNVYNKHYVGSRLANPDFAQIASDMGANGIRVERIGELEPALRNALEDERPSVIDVIVDPGILTKGARLAAVRKSERRIFKS